MAILPIVILYTLMNLMIISVVSGSIMFELQMLYPNTTWPLYVAILIAVIVYIWISFNHKLSDYIKMQGTKNE